MARAIVFALKQAETGVAVAVAEVCRKMGISEATYYNWKKKYGGLGVAELRRLHQLEEENRQLKQLVAEWSATAAEPGQTDASGCAQKKALRPQGRLCGPATKTGLKFNGKLWHGPPRAFRPVVPALLFSSVDPLCTTNLVVEKTL